MTSKAQAFGLDGETAHIRFKTTPQSMTCKRQIGPYTNRGAIGQIVLILGRVIMSSVHHYYPNTHL